MYLDYVVDIPDVKGKITFRSKGNGYRDLSSGKIA